MSLAAPIHLGLELGSWRMPKVRHIPHSYSGQHWSAFWWRRTTSHGPHVGAGKEGHRIQRNKQWYSLEQDLKYGRLSKKVKRAAKEYKYASPLGTDNRAEKARGGVAGTGWRWAKGGRMKDICNSVNNLYV